MGPRPSRRIRLLSPRREIIPDAEPGINRHGLHLDAVVLDHQAEELPVSFSSLSLSSLPLSPHIHPLQPSFASRFSVLSLYNPCLK